MKHVLNPTPEQIENRIQQLAAWPANLADTGNDPRCDCEPDCWWNSIGQLSRELGAVPA